MRTTLKPSLRLCLALCASAALAGCAGNAAAPSVLFDFGPLPVPSAGVPAPAPINALVIADATGSALLDSQSMYYRLNYADPLQARAYANSHWSSTPLQLLTSRLKTRIAQAGVKVLALTDASNDAPLLRIEVDEFAHNFDSPSQNSARLVLRASLFRGHQLVDQQTFIHQNASHSADAAGGARALAQASDAAAQDILVWLATLKPRKE